MDKEKWDGTFHFTPLMDRVNIQNPEPFHFDVTRKHWKFVEFTFMGAPVVSVFLFVDETLHIGKGDAIVLAGVAYFIREAGIGEFLTKKGKSIIGYGNLEAGFRGHAARRKSEWVVIADWFELIYVPALGLMIQMTR